MEEYKIYVGNLSYSTNDESLKRHFDTVDVLDGELQRSLL